MLIFSCFKIFRILAKHEGPPSSSTPDRSVSVVSSLGNISAFCPQHHCPHIVEAQIPRGSSGRSPSSPIKLTDHSLTFTQLCREKVTMKRTNPSCPRGSRQNLTASSPVSKLSGFWFCLFLEESAIVLGFFERGAGLGRIVCGLPILVVFALETGSHFSPGYPRTYYIA